MSTRAKGLLSSSSLLFFVAVAGCGGGEAPPAKAPETSAAKSAPTTETAAATPAATTTATTTETAPADPLVGKPAPALEAKAHDGTKVSLAASKGKQPVVVYFYPKDETPGCTKEACAFRDAWGDLAKANVLLVGVSSDTAESHKAFAAHHKLPFHLVSDSDGSIAKAFGVPNRDGFLARQTFVIDKDGNVKKVYREVDVSKHAADILADVK